MKRLRLGWAGKVSFDESVLGKNSRGMKSPSIPMSSCARLCGMTPKQTEIGDQD